MRGPNQNNKKFELLPVWVVGPGKGAWEEWSYAEMGSPVP